MPSRKKASKRSKGSRRRKSIRKPKNFNLIVASNTQAPLLKGSQEGPPVLTAGETLSDILDTNISGGGHECPVCKKGEKVQFPKPKTWSWTRFNATVRQAIENMLYWKPEFKRYFNEKSIVVNAYRSDATYIWNERAVIEIVENPREHHFKTKLVITVVFSKSLMSGAKYYSASAYETTMNPYGYHPIDESNEVLTYFRFLNLA
jgi:hypothetical protein